MAPPTVLAVKQNFLLSQTRLLSQPLAPSRAWRTANDAADDGRLSEKAVDDALYRLNHALQQHSRRAYAPQATRHVAEQIDQLYWTSTSAGREDEAGMDLSVGADLTDGATIAALPSTWEDERQVAAYPAEAKRYQDLAVRLQELSTQRAAARERMSRLRRMGELVTPFVAANDEDDADGSAMKSVQENLVTRDGEVERELNRMRMLLARVGDKVGRLRDEERDEEEGALFRETSMGGSASSALDGTNTVESADVEERRKVDALLQRAFKRQKGDS